MHNKPKLLTIAYVTEQIQSMSGYRKNGERTKDSAYATVNSHTVHTLPCIQDQAKLVGDRTNIHYQVKQVDSSDHEKTVFLEGLYGQEAVMLHLHDGWADTPVSPGDSLNLIAEKTQDVNGRLHALCSWQAVSRI